MYHIKSVIITVIIGSICRIYYIYNILFRNRSIYLLWCVTNIVKGDVKNGNQVRTYVLR